MIHSEITAKTTLRVEKITEAIKFSDSRTIYGQVTPKTKIICFDKKNNTIISGDALFDLIKHLGFENVFSENVFVSPECYILVDRNGKDCYPFPVGEIDEWEKDGSFEHGDTLYKMNILNTL